MLVPAGEHTHTPLTALGPSAWTQQPPEWEEGGRRLAFTHQRRLRRPEGSRQFQLPAGGFHPSEGIREFSSGTKAGKFAPLHPYKRRRGKVGDFASNTHNLRTVLSTLSVL